MGWPEHTSVEHDCSKVLFGGKHRLTILSEVAGEDGVTAKVISNEIDISPALAIRELRRFEDIGLLVRRPQQTVTDELVFDRNPEVDWEVVQAALQEVWKLADVPSET